MMQKTERKYTATNRIVLLFFKQKKYPRYIFFPGYERICILIECDLYGMNLSAFSKDIFSLKFLLCIHFFLLYLLFYISKEFGDDLHFFPNG